LTEDLSLHIFELPKIIINPMRAGVRTPLDEWLNFFNNADQETEESMRKNYHNPMILKAYDLLENMSADEETRVRAKAREKALKDEKSFLAEAERKGIEKGMKIGKAEGKAENRKEMALKLISMGILTDEQVAEATGFTVQEIETLKSEK
jgi:predicted transposase/invertase (TIGR01784 family)